MSEPRILTDAEVAEVETVWREVDAWGGNDVADLIASLRAARSDRDAWKTAACQIEQEYKGYSEEVKRMIEEHATVLRRLDETR